MPCREFGIEPHSGDPQPYDLTSTTSRIGGGMVPHEVRRCCLGMQGAFEDFPFGEQVSVFKVVGKIFAIADLHALPLEVSLKCAPDEAEALRSEHPAIRPGYHLNKRHWNTVTLDGSIPDDQIEGMIQDSYDLVVATLTRPQREDLRRTNPRRAVPGDSSANDC
jgi:predicted DNA-binding protein (MmcQ/YjbR family)